MHKYDVLVGFMHAFRSTLMPILLAASFREIINRCVPSFNSSLLHNPEDTSYNPLVQALGGAHGCLNGQRAHVLPALLQKRDEVVDGQHNVTNQLILRHANVSDSDTHAEHLLQLELDGGLDLGHLGGEILVVRDGGGELSGLGETRSEKTRNLLDEGIGGDKGVVLASELLDELLVLVELLQVLCHC
jgi:hypothetical protein